jgi:hypothetical protein
VHPLQQRECPARQALRDEHAGQHQVLGLPGIGQFVVGGQAALLDPATGGGHVALGQQQPGPFGRDGVEQAGHARIRGEARCLAHRVDGPGRVPLRLLDPREQGQADG